MWDKTFREIIFLVLYNQQFWEKKMECNQDSSAIITENDFEFYCGLVELTTSTVDSDKNKIWYSQMLLVLPQILNNYKDFIIILEPLVTDWNRTNIMLQTLMIEFLGEKEGFELDLISNNSKKLMNEYLHLANKYLEENNVATLHAVLSQNLNLAKQIA